MCCDYKKTLSFTSADGIVATKSQATQVKNENGEKLTSPEKM